MRNRLFLDTSYSIALTIANDANHASARTLAEKIKASPVQITTTQPVLLEIGNALSQQIYRGAAIGIIERFKADPNTSIVSLTDDLFEKGLELFQGRPDKDWGLVDCISFVVMSERGITDAFTTDGDFVQAGFRALLRED